jgi:hypothetical protein
MGIRKYHPFIGDPVDIRRLQFRVFIQGRHVPISHIIGKDENDIGFLRILCLSGTAGT